MSLFMSTDNIQFCDGIGNGDMRSNSTVFIENGHLIVVQLILSCTLMCGNETIYLPSK